MNNGLIALTVILSVFGCCLILGIIYLIYHEKKGSPAFTPLMQGEKDDGFPMQRTPVMVLRSTDNNHV